MPNRSNTPENLLQGQVIHRRAWMVENAPRRDCAILRLEFPHIDFTASANTAPRPAAVPSERAVTGAGSTVQRVITEAQQQELAQDRFRTEAQQNVQLAYDQPEAASASAQFEVSTTPSVSAAPVEEMSPEQIQFISDAQKKVQGAYNEPLA